MSSTGYPLKVMESRSTSISLVPWLLKKIPSGVRLWTVASTFLSSRSMLSKPLITMWPC